MLEGAPASISITFNEPIEKTFHSLQVTNPSGQQVNEGVSRIDDTNSARLIADLQPELPDGIYTVNYKVLSSDGHTVTGTFPFIIGNGAAEQSPSAPKESGSSTGGDWPGLHLLLVRWLQYTGLALYMGTLLFHLLLLPRHGARRVAPAKFDDGIALQGDSVNSSCDDDGPQLQNQSWHSVQSSIWQRSKWLLALSFTLAGAGIGLSLPQQTASGHGIPWSQAWNLAFFKETLMLTSFGHIWLFEMALLLLLGVLTGILAAYAHRSRFIASWGTAVAWITSLAILLAKSFIGHSAAVNGRGLAITMNFLHQASSFTWLGGLLSLAFLLPAAARCLRAETSSRHLLYWGTIRRFSILAAGCVIILLLSGIYASLLYVPTWHALLNSNYGLVLLIKATLTLIMLVLGLSAFLRGRRQSHPLGAGVWIEFILGLIVLVIAALLANMPTALSSPGPVHLKGTTTGGYQMAVKITPNIVGQNRFEVTVQDRDQRPLDDIEQITLTLTSLEMDTGKIELIIPKGESAPLNGDAILTMGGRWNLHVHVLRSSLETIDSRFTFQAGSP